MSTRSSRGSEIVYSDEGPWLTRLAHGRYQINGESGYYDTADSGAFEVQGDDLVLKTKRYDTPKTGGSLTLPHRAAMLTGLKKGPQFTIGEPDLVFKYGSIRWVAKMPNRRYAWPALWLLSLHDHSSGVLEPQWPFEIDVYEGFGYDPSWNLPGGISSYIHGGVEGSSNSNMKRGAYRPEMKDLGLENTLDSEFHSYACTITPDWITTYMDGLEFVRMANPFNSTEGWYPLMNVAVKAPLDAPYNDGSGDMHIRSVQIWRAE